MGVRRFAHGRHEGVRPRTPPRRARHPEVHRGADDRPPADHADRPRVRHELRPVEARDDDVPAGAAPAAGRALSTIVETARLRLREVAWDDLDEVAAMVADAEQMAFYAAPRTREE